MAKLLRCRDLGFDCDHNIRAETNEQVLQQAATHAQRDHGLTEISDEVVQKVLAAIREG